MEAFCDNCKVEIDRSERHTLFSGKGCFCSKECLSGYYLYVLNDAEKAKQCGTMQPKQPLNRPIVRKDVSKQKRDKNAFMKK